MDTRLATTQYRLHQWAEIIKARNASGMKIDEYCKQNTKLHLSAINSLTKNSATSEKTLMKNSMTIFHFQRLPCKD